MANISRRSCRLRPLLVLLVLGSAAGIKDKVAGMLDTAKDKMGGPGSKGKANSKGELVPMRRFPQVNPSDWSINGPQEQEYMKAIVQESGGVGMVLGMVMSMVMLVTFMVTKTYFGGGLCSTGRLARGSGFHRSFCWICLILLTAGLGLCGIKTLIGSEHLAAGVNKIFSSSIDTAQDTAKFMCGGPLAAKRMAMSSKDLNFKPLAPRDAAQCANVSMIGFVRNVTMRVNVELGNVEGMVGDLSKISTPVQGMSQSLSAVAQSMTGIQASVNAAKGNISALEQACQAVPGLADAGTKMPAGGLLDGDVAPLQTARTQVQAVRAKMTTMFSAENGMVGNLQNGVISALAPAKKMLAAQVQQTEMMLLGLQDKILSSRLMLTKTKKEYNSYAFTQIPHVLGGLALIPLFINVFAMVGLLLGFKIFTKFSAMLTFIFLFWFCFIGGLFRVIHAVTYDVCAEHEALLTYYTKDYEFQLPNSNATLALAPHWKELLYCGTGAVINGTRAPSNFVDVYHLRQALNLETVIEPMLKQVSGMSGQFKPGSMLNGTTALLSSMPSTAIDLSQFTGQLANVEISLGKQMSGLPRLSATTGQLDFTDPNTRTTFDAKLPAGGKVADVETILVAVNKITKPVVANGKEYTLNTARALTAARLQARPLSGVSDAAQKAALAKQVGLLQPFNTMVAAVEAELTKLAAVQAALAGTKASLGRVEAMQKGLKASKVTVQKDVASLKAALGGMSGSFDDVLAGFRAITPVVKATAADYTSCGWVAKNYASMKVAICAETVNGLHDIGLYLFAGAVLFFLSFFLHLHTAAFLAAYEEHGYEMVELTDEFGAVLKG